MMTNLLFSQLTAIGKRFAMVLTMLLIVGIGQVWGAVTPLPLPYSWGAGDGKSKYTNDLGCTQNGLGSDYNTSGTLLKFDGTGDYLIIQLKDAPGTLSYNIKGNSFSGGTFTIQESADGENFSNLGTYSKDGTQTHNLLTSTRYIRFIYTNKSSGNIGLGTISITAVTGDSGGGNTDDGNGGGNYTITFATGTNTTATTSNVQLITMIESGSENVSSFSIDATDIYVYHKGAGTSNNTGSGLRLGKNGGKGKITFNLSNTISTACLSELTISTVAWDASTTITLIINGDKNLTYTTTAGENLTYRPSNPIQLSSITLSADKRAFIKAINITTTQCSAQPSRCLTPKCGDDSGGTWLVVSEW